MKTIKQIITITTLIIILLPNTIFSQDNRTISLDDAKNISKYHNEILSKSMKNIEMTIDDLKNNIIKLTPKELNITQQNQLLDFISENDIKSQEIKIYSFLQSQLSINIYNSAKSIILGNSKNTIELLKLKVKEASKLKGKEKEILYTFIEVSIGSINFWNEFKEIIIPKKQEALIGAQLDMLMEQVL